MTIDDLDDVVAAAALAFPALFEERARFEERLSLSPSSCFTLVNPQGALKGYLIAFPWPFESIPPLNVGIGAIPADARTLYIHDLVLVPDARGQGHTQVIIDQIARQAQLGGWQAVALVAVNNTVEFWRRNGFEVHDRQVMRERLARYGEDARYMVRKLER